IPFVFPGQSAPPWREFLPSWRCVCEVPLESPLFPGPPLPPAVRDPGTISWPGQFYAAAACSAFPGAFLQDMMARHKVVGANLPHSGYHMSTDLCAVFAAGVEL